MDKLSGLPLEGGISNLSELSDASLDPAKSAGTHSPAPSIGGALPGDSIQNAVEAMTGGIIPDSGGGLLAPGTAPSPDPLPELSAQLGTQLTLSHLRSDLKPAGNAAASALPSAGMDTAMAPAPAGIETAAPTASGAGDAVSSTIQGILGSLYQQAQQYLSRVMEQASVIVNNADASAGLMEQQAQSQAAQIRDQAGQQAQVILANAQQAWVSALSAFGLPTDVPAGGADPTVIGPALPPPGSLPEAPADSAGAGSEPLPLPPPPEGWGGWDSYFQQARFDADSLISGGQLQADALLSEVMATCERLRNEAWGEAQSIQRSAIQLSSSMGDNIRSIQDMVRNDWFSPEPFNQTANLLQEMAVKDDDRKQEIEGQLRSLEKIRDLVRKPGQ